MRILSLIFLLGASTSLWAGGNAARGEQLAATCAACHGPGGVSSSPAVPTIAGQYRDYLVISLQQYQSGARNNPVMSAQAANLSEQDIEDLAAYFAKQPGPLYTPRIHQ